VSVQHYRLGCPVWSFRGWQGGLYSADARPTDFLRQYATVFNTVEGNTTFYNPEPSASSVLRWRSDTPPGFRFCFKLPAAITHERALVGAGPLASAFLARMAPLGERLGPFMIQLPSGFGPRQLGDLRRFLAGLPRELRFAVELRHPSFFGATAAARDVRELLGELGCDRIWLDTRGLRAGPQSHPAVRDARHVKPDLPVEPVATGPTPLVRFISHPEPGWNEAPLEEWAATLAGWIRAGREPYLLVHCPDDSYAPAQARRAHALLAKHASVGELPAFPGERGESAGGQLRLL
jgi:uncharacterized protein YecE (DUF72 family)